MQNREYKTHLRYADASNRLHKAGIECGYKLAPWRLYIKRNGRARFISVRRAKRIAAKAAA